MAVTKYNRSGIRKIIFAIAAVAIVSTAGSVAYARGVPGVADIFGRGQGNHGNQGDRDGYGGNQQHQKAVKQLFKRVSRANNEYAHTNLHSFWQVSKKLSPQKYINFQTAVLHFQNLANSAQSEFIVAANAAAASSTDSQFNTKFNTAQTKYMNQLRQAERTLLVQLAERNVPAGGLAEDLSDARNVLNTYLDFAQAKFVQQNGDPRHRSADANDDSDDVNHDDSQRGKQGKYNAAPQEFKVNKSQNEQDN